MGDFFAWALDVDRPVWVLLVTVTFLVVCSTAFVVGAIITGAWYMPVIAISFAFGRVIALYRREKRK